MTTKGSTTESLKNIHSSDTFGTQKKKGKKGLSASQHCKNPQCLSVAAKGRTGFCGPCYTQDWKAKNPFKYAYNRFKSNAKKRNIPFELTLEQFKEFAIETEILLGRGRTSLAWHIDRIEDYDNDGNKLPYRVGNLQKLTNKDNITKENKRRAAVRQKVVKYDEYKGGLTTAPVPVYVPDPTVPF